MAGRCEARDPLGERKPFVATLISGACYIELIPPAFGALSLSPGLGGLLLFRKIRRADLGDRTDGHDYGPIWQYHRID